MRHIRKVLRFFLTLIPLIGLIACEKSAEKPDWEEEVLPLKLSIEVQQVLEKKEQMIRALLSKPAIVQAVRTSNSKHQHITPGEISKLDKEWRKVEGISDFMKGLMTNSCARKLIQFQGSHEGFAEIFVTGAKGLNVCQTNKTTDYYQADETWWVQSFNSGKGKSYHGEIEYDESSHSEAISLYVPIMDSKTHQAIGVCKAVVAIAILKKEL